jgi:predicted dienelactone hydrolase
LEPGFDSLGETVTTSYDPFTRGPFPVGVRTEAATDRTREGRTLALEVWYPAAARHAGQDLAGPTRDTFAALPGGPKRSQAAVRDAEAHRGSWPLIAYSHTSNGHRRQSTMLCTHLVSHGYVVVAADHAGCTEQDAAERERRAAVGVPETPAQREARVQEWIASRGPDISLALDHVLGGGVAELHGLVDPERIGVAGWSFGGWAALAAPESDRRIRVVLAMAPAGSARPLPGIIPATLSFEWKRDVPTLFLVADRDQFTPLDGMDELFARVPATKQMVVLGDADHGHFGDLIEEVPGFCSAEHAHAFVRALGCAHMDAFLKQETAARRFLAGDLEGALAARGVSVLPSGQ